MKKIIIFAVGKDQPGIVSAFTCVLYEQRCNLEDTSMTILEDHFTMLFILSAPEDLTIEYLEACLTSVSQNFNLKFAIHGVEIEKETPSSRGNPWMLSVTGPDQTGIMYHITCYLAQYNINIKQLTSKKLSRSQGLSLFLMAMEIEVPVSMPENTFQKDLSLIAQKEGLEIHAEPLEVYTL